jgi:predicted Zn-dependent protease
MRAAATLAAVAALLVAPAAGAAPGEVRARLSDKSVSAEAIRQDVRAEIRFGREVAARILARHPLADDAELLRYVNLVGRAVARDGGRPELTYRFGVLETDAVNAFAAPGGYVFVTRGALERMENEAELAGVLAHEIAHVNRRHIVEELGIRGREGSAVAGVARFLGGAGEATRMAFSQAVERAVDILFESGRERADELEADRLGTTLLAIAGYRADALRGYLARVAEAPEDRTADRRRTHPDFATRLTELDRVLREEGLSGADGRLMAQRFARRLARTP